MHLVSELPRRSRAKGKENSGKSDPNVPVHYPQIDWSFQRQIIEATRVEIRKKAKRVNGKEKKTAHHAQSIHCRS